MNDSQSFQREERYVVVKISKLHPHPVFRNLHIQSIKQEYSDALVDCVVVEADWPEYNVVWKMLEERVNGQRDPKMGPVAEVSEEPWHQYAPHPDEDYTPEERGCPELEPKPDVPYLAIALRQYQHNDGSGLVFGYDKSLMDQYVSGLVEVLEVAYRYMMETSVLIDGEWGSCRDFLTLEREGRLDEDVITVRDALASYRKGE